MLQLVSQTWRPLFGLLATDILCDVDWPKVFGWLAVRNSLCVQLRWRPAVNADIGAWLMHNHNKRRRWELPSNVRRASDWIFQFMLCLACLPSAKDECFCDDTWASTGGPGHEMVDMIRPQESVWRTWRTKSICCRHMRSGVIAN